MAAAAVADEEGVLDGEEDAGAELTGADDAAEADA